MRSCKVDIDGRACFLWAFMLLLLPLRWMAAFFLASAWHECCHFWMLYFLGVKIDRIQIGMGGVIMGITQLPTGQELLAALAGPLGGFLLLAFYRRYPELALCALVQSVYNLLPVYPLDGGRVARCLCELAFPGHVDPVCWVVEASVLVGIFILGLFVNWGIVSIVTAAVLVCKLLRGKIPCKPCNLRVQ